MSRPIHMRHLLGVVPSDLSRAKPRGASNLLLLFLLIAHALIPHVAFAQRPPEPGPELTLAEYRLLLPDHSAEPSPEAAARRPDDTDDALDAGTDAADSGIRADGADRPNSPARIFFALLAVQGREAAARQSLDRLAGWTSAAETRLAAQSAPVLEVEMLRFAEARAEVRLERFEAQRRRALAAANRLLGRDPASPLLALTTVTHPPDALSNAPPASSPPPSGEKPSDFAPPIARFEQDLLPQGHDLLAKTYQNYLFGGVALSALLWQEEHVHQTELQYRLLLVEAERSRHAGD